ncbi:bestrophin family protein [Labrys okinawensis]|uniref:bestrophin family protein n=1 Tax=Labrys okinawensis TaxID=346911 RepID=UPI0039BD3207
MIVRKNPRPWELFFILRGSIVPQIWPQMLVVALISVTVTLLETRGYIHVAPIAALPFSLIGVALSIFSAFRNTASYDRWWEARKILGAMVIDARGLSRQAIAYLATDPATARRLALYATAFSDLVRCHLRDEKPDEEALRHLDAGDRELVLNARHAPNRLLARMSGAIADALSQGQIPAQLAQTLEERVSALSADLTAAERIKLTPLPFAYSLLLHRTAYLFCFLLPFGLADSMGLWAPLIAAIVSYTFFGLDVLGDELVAPFGTTQNSLPVMAICRTIEVNILEDLGETDLPSLPKPKDFVLV